MAFDQYASAQQTADTAAARLARRLAALPTHWRIYAASSAVLHRASAVVGLLALGAAAAAFGLWRANTQPALGDAPPSLPAPRVISTERSPWPAPEAINQVLLDMDIERETAGLRWGATAMSVRDAEAGPPCVLCRREIELALSGGYEGLRQMIAQLLNRHPSLALNALDVQRVSASSDAIHARAQWVWMHAAKAHASAAIAMPQRSQIAPASADPFELPKPVRVKPRPVAPPSPPPPPVVVAPSAPALPFRFLGRVQGAQGQGADVAVFLSAGTSVLRVRAGDTLLGQYRVDAIEPGAIRFTYLPLGQQQSLLLRN